MSETIGLVENKSEIKEGGQGQKMYSNEEAVNASTEYFGGDTLAGTVWVNKYALKDSEGNLFEKTPDDMHLRIASEISRIENKKGYPDPLTKEEVYSLLKNFKYIIPQGSPMSGIGNTLQKVSLSNCFVIGNTVHADSYGEIMKVDEEQVQLMKRRGGVGHDLSHLRPSGSPVTNSALTSTGIVPFMERYSNSTREVAQDGRRGALMLSLSIKHPDAEKFIDAKMSQGKVTGANVSVKVDDDFMKAVESGEKYLQKYPVDSENPTHKIEIDAKNLWEKIVHNAWKSAEPGVLFWDTVKKESIPDCYSDLGFKTTSTNPCGEIPLCPYDSCRLLAINLYSYVKNPFTDDAEFDLGLFKRHARYAQRMMDSIIDLELEKIDSILEKIKNDPEPEETKRTEYNLWSKIKLKAVQGRRTGIGITAEGDMLAALGLRYGSEEGTRFSVKVHKALAIEAYRSSINLAKERGKFPIFDFEREKENPFIKRLFDAEPELEEEMKKHGRRNIALLTIAPTGTVSLMAQSTSGIEPVFLPVYKRRRKVNPGDKNANIAFVDEVGDAWEEYNVFHPQFETWLGIKGYNVDEVKALNEEKLKMIIEKSPYYKATSADVDWIQKVKLQGAVQKWVDHSISVTINIPENTPEEMVAQLYMAGWKEGCKGITVYREGSRSGVLVSKKEKKEDEKEEKESFKELAPLVVPSFAPAVKLRQQTPYGNVHMQIIVDPKNDYIPIEVFAQLGNAGSEEAALMEALGRLTSMWLRKRQPIEQVIAQLKDIGSGKGIATRDGGVHSLPMGFARGLMKFVTAKEMFGMGHLLIGEVDYLEVERRIADYLRTGKDPFDKESEEEVSDGINILNTNGKSKNNGLFSQRCPDCKSSLVIEEGCQKCYNCGYSKCG